MRIAGVQRKLRAPSFGPSKKPGTRLTRQALRASITLGPPNLKTEHADAPRHHPGLLLRDVVFPALGLTVSQAARDLGVTRQTLHRLLAGQAAVSLEMAMRLEKLCGVQSTFWLEQQYGYELDRLRKMSAGLLSGIPSHVLPSKAAKQIGATHGR